MCGKAGEDVVQGCEMRGVSSFHSLALMFQSFISLVTSREKCPWFFVKREMLTLFPVIYARTQVIFLNLM